MAGKAELSRSTVAERLKLSMDQVVYRLRKGDIKGRQVDGWVWLIPESEIERVQGTEWYANSKKQEPATA